MLPINKFDKKRLEKVGLWRHKREGRYSQESNFSVCNKKHKSRAKTYYVVEELNVLRFLGMWDIANVQKISEEQFNDLKQKNILNEHNIQKYNEYVEKAKCFFDKNGDIYVARDRKILLALK